MSVPRWNKGSEVVERLLESGHLQRVPADEATVEALLAQLAATSRRRQPLPQAIQRAHMPSAYDAARKTATALLAHQGLRPTTTGGHIVLVDSVTAQFPNVPGLKSIDRMRRRRNQSEYPEPSTYDPVTTEEADDAVAVASECVSTATRLIEAPQLGVF